MAITHQSQTKTDPHEKSFSNSAQGKDDPIGRRSPQAPFAFVGLSYLAVLAVIGVIIGIVLFSMA